MPDPIPSLPVEPEQPELLDSVYLHACLSKDHPGKDNRLTVTRSELLLECNKEILRFAAVKMPHLSDLAPKFKHALLLLRKKSTLRQEILSTSDPYQLRKLWVNLLREKAKAMVRKRPSVPKIDPNSVVGKFIASQRNARARADSSHPGGDESDSCPELVDQSSDSSDFSDDSDSEDDERAVNNPPAKVPRRNIKFDADARDNVRRIRKG